jgi:hypothetical protein
LHPIDSVFENRVAMPDERPHSQMGGVASDTCVVDPQSDLAGWNGANEFGWWDLDDQSLGRRMVIQANI